MKKAGCVLLTLIFALSFLSVNSSALGKIGAAAAVLIDADTGDVLYQKNMTKRMYPASITKILTGLIVLENCSTDEAVTVNDSASSARLPRGYSHIGLKAGERLSVNEAMYALLLHSANDAANALAEHVGGTQAGFASLMNRRADEIGAWDSRFANASGIPANNHYTTAYDMALITLEASKNPAFMRYFGATEYTLSPTNKRGEELEISGYHFMLLDDHDEYNPDVTGGKIGYTNQAKHTMSTVASRDGHTLICVVMGSGTSSGKYEDTQALLDYGFERLSDGMIVFHS